MGFDIDVSGNDLLSKDYTICIADNNSIIKGFKFDNKLVQDLSSKYGQGIYKYKKSKKGKSTFKVRLYSIVLYHLIKSLKIKKEISLNICRDFYGRDDDIKKNIKFFLENKLKISLGDRIYFTKLNADSNAHRYSYLMRRDTKNKMQTYIKISLEDFEKWLIK